MTSFHSISRFIDIRQKDCLAKPTIHNFGRDNKDEHSRVHVPCAVPLHLFPATPGPHEPSGTKFSDFHIFKFIKTRSARPLYPRKQTSPNAIGTYALCYEPTSRVWFEMTDEAAS
jgi:hypothetical protein